MTAVVLGTPAATPFGDVGTGNALLQKLQRDGRLPTVSVIIKPLGATGDVVLDRFLTYQFSSSILIPVDTFNFNFVAPDGPPLNKTINDGDIAALAANDVQIATGIIDSTEVETDSDFGEKGSLQGRDLMSQLEDQDAISLDSKPIWANQFSVENAVRALLDNTRITRIELRDAPSSQYLLASEPGESKLAALQRFLEPLNCVAWMGATGTLIVGKPNMSQAPRGRIVVSKENRFSNVLSIKVTRASTRIPNAVIPVWSGQEITVTRKSVDPAFLNKASGPSRLFKLGHRLPKTVVVSAPNATDPQGLASVNAISAAGGNLLQAAAKREIARQNTNEMIVQAVAMGHFDESGNPYVVDTVYRVTYDRGDVDEAMYLYQVDYQLTEAGGQRTNLYFCRLGTIVSDVKAP